LKSFFLYRLKFWVRSAFQNGSSLSSITFESGSRFPGNEREVLSQAGWIARRCSPTGWGGQKRLRFSFNKQHKSTFF
jgi:hypothetical protein